MKRTTKVFALLLCAAICTLGAILSLRGNTEDAPPKRNAVPIDNRDPQRGVWIWA